MSAWKQFERFVSNIFNTTRTPLSGGNGKVTRSDTFHSKLFLSMKYTQSNNKGLRALVDEERAKAAAEDKIAVCVIGEAGDRGNALVVIHLRDLHPFCEAVKSGSIQTTLVPSQKRSERVGTGTVAG
jgi:hypothetical protein